MESEWQDDIWDYTQGADFYDEDESKEPREEGEEEDEGGEEGRDEDPFAEGGEEDIEFAPDFKQLQQLSYENKSTTTGPSAGFQKAQRTPEEATIDQIQGVLSSSYSELTEPRRQKIISIAEKTKGAPLLNVETFVLAALWVAEALPLNKANLQTFVNKYKDKNQVGQVDLIRYIRMLTQK